MTHAETLLALAARCEAGTGPDRALDVAIFRAVTPGAKQYRPKSSTARKVGLTEVGGCIVPNPAYTASLDAATTLVPAGWASHHSNRPWLAETNIKPAEASVWARFQGAASFTGSAPTPARALTAAALRALAAEAGNER